MPQYTRRTHVVRIYDSSSGKKDKSTFVDVEVLDAISFRVENGKEVVLNMQTSKAQVHRTDDIGTNSANTPSKPTRRTHMHKVKSADGSQYCGVEVLDAAAFRDAENWEWILNMPDDNAVIYDSTTGNGSNQSTRRSHDEKLTPNPKDKDKDPKQYLKVQRDDIVAFRTINGHEVIVKMPSHDDGSDPGRASTYISDPRGYDPTNDNITPPDIDDLNEPHVYFKFMKDSKGILISGDDKVRMGPFWWLRRISGGEIACLEVKVQWTNIPTATMPGITLDTNFGYDIVIGTDISGPSQDLGKGTITDNGNSSTFYFDGFAAKIMPKPGDKSNTINLVKDTIWWTNVANTTVAKDGNFTALVWFNISKLRPLMPKDDPTIKFRVRITPLPRPAPDPAQGTGYYIWANYIVYGDGAGVPDAQQAGYGLPLPTKQDGLGPDPVRGADGFDPYAMTYNYQEATSYPSAMLRNYNPSFRPSDFPGSNPNGANLGFTSASGAQAWADALNTAWANELAATEQARDILRSKGFKVDDTGAYLNYTVVAIDYGDGKTPPPPSSSVTATLGDFTGVLSFDYGSDNTPNFDFPKDPYSQSKAVLGINDDWQIIEFDIDKDRKVTATVTTVSGATTPDLLGDQTGGKAGEPEETRTS